MILVTGATGKVGRAAVNQLHDAGSMFVHSSANRSKRTCLPA